MKEVKLPKKYVKDAARVWAANTLRNCALDSLTDYFSDADSEAITNEITKIANNLSLRFVNSVEELHDIYYEAVTTPNE